MDDPKNSVQLNIVVFSLDELQYALDVSNVLRVVRAVEITPLPKSPAAISGVINYHGEFLPVIDVRSLFRLTKRNVRLEDQFIIARSSQRRVVLAVDSVNGVHTLEQYRVVNSKESLPATVYLSGLTSIDHSIVLITDLEQFLSMEEEHILEEALSGDAL
ncbi:MAG: chemotaxis protein CheW [Bacteroidota bacterium]